MSYPFLCRSGSDYRGLPGGRRDCLYHTARRPRLSPSVSEIHDELLLVAPLDTSLLIWGLLFGSIGFGFFMYGRKQRAVVPFVCGFALMIFPYFVPNTFLLITIGIALIAIPYFVRL